MDIVDAQVHANMLGTEVTLAIMDALGVQGVLFDEYQRTDGDGAAQPGYQLADGTFRPIGPNAESAALRHPERFAFLMRVDPRDPGIEGWIETLATTPGFKALRTIVLTQADAAVFGDGGSDRLLKAARAHSLPLFVTCPGADAAPGSLCQAVSRRAVRHRPLRCGVRRTPRQSDDRRCDHDGALPQCRLQVGAHPTGPDSDQMPRRRRMGPGFATSKQV